MTKSFAAWRAVAYISSYTLIFIIPFLLLLLARSFF
nr:MAG TPA: hypothetical protein [Caudoviricetes sp.]